MNQFEKTFAALFMALLIAGCATQQTVPTEQFSGYLGNYSKLKPAKDAAGRDVLLWQSRKLKPGVYSKLILDPIVFYPAPRTSSQISSKTLYAMRNYLNNAVVREVGKAITLTDKPGPGVLRLRAAITGAATEAEGLKAYEYIPVALIAVGATSAAGGRDREAFVVLEAELLDSGTGKRLMIGVRKHKAKKLLENDKEQLTLGHVRSMLDELAVTARKFVEQNVK